jgi:hypothetical protein
MVELVLLAVGWGCAVVHPATAAQIVRLAEKLPDPKWYWPNDMLTVPGGRKETNK